MRSLLSLLAVAGLVTACGDTPTQPESARPAVRTRAFTESGNPNGRLRLFWPQADDFCGAWDAEGAPVYVNCSNFYTPNSEIYGFTIWADDKILNSTGRAVVFGPTHYPSFLTEIYETYYGITPRNGLMPLCDWNLRLYPDAYDTWDLSTMLCTTNWSYTISASGKARMHALFDPAHTYDPYP